MKKVLLLVLLMVSMLHAGFWESINEQTLFETSLVSVQENNNTSEDNATIEEDSKFKEKIVFFNQLIQTMKTQPYLLKDKSTAFYDKQQSILDQEILRSKITSNKRKGYHLSVLRDTLTLKNNDVKKHTYLSLLLLTNLIQDANPAGIEKSINEQLTFLKTIDMDLYQHTLQETKDKTSKTYKKAFQNYTTLATSHAFSQGFYTYLHNHLSLLKNNSYLSMFDLGGLIEKINAQPYLSKVNFYLKKIHTDAGRLSLFLLVVLLFTLLRNVIFAILLPALKRLLDDGVENMKDILVDNFDQIKKPLSYIVLIFGIDLALEVLAYPEPVSDVWVNVSYLLYLLIYARMAVVLVDIVLEIFLTTKNKKAKSLRKELVNLLVIIAKTIIYVVVFLLFIRQIGVDITGFIASLGIGGLAFAFAAKDTIANFFGSIKIIIDNAFSQGDWIKTSDAEGTVVQLGLISTTIRTFDNALVTVPNANIANSAIKNWNRRKVGRRIKMYIGVTYDAKQEDLKNAVTQIREMLVNHPDIATAGKSSGTKQGRKLLSYEDDKGVKKTLLVYVDSFGASSIDILIYVFTNTTNWNDWLQIKEDVLYNIWDILEQNNLELAFPSQTLYLKNDSTTGKED